MKRQVKKTLRQQKLSKRFAREILSHENYHLINCVDNENERQTKMNFIQDDINYNHNDIIDDDFYSFQNNDYDSLLNSIRSESA